MAPARFGDQPVEPVEGVRFEGNLSDFGIEQSRLQPIAQAHPIGAKQRKRRVCIFEPTRWTSANYRSVSAPSEPCERIQADHSVAYGVPEHVRHRTCQPALVRDQPGPITTLEEVTYPVVAAIESLCIAGSQARHEHRKGLPLAS